MVLDYGRWRLLSSTGFREAVYSIECNSLLLQTCEELYRVF